MNCWIYSLSIHVAPSRTSISDASKSLGWAAVNAFILIWNLGSAGNASCAKRSFSRTLPDRYSSAGTYLSFVGSTKITPVSSWASSSSVFPVSWLIYSISTPAFSEMESAKASEAVSTLVTTSWGLIVRLVNISALRERLLSSSSISKEHSR